MSLLPDLSPGLPGPVHVKAITFRKAKGKPNINADFTLVHEIDEDTSDPVLPMPIAYARSVLVQAMAGGQGQTIRADVLTDGVATISGVVNGEPDELLTDLPACLRKITLHANEGAPRIVWLLRVDASPALGEIILGCLDSDVEVAFSPRQQDLPLGTPPVESVPGNGAPARASRRKAPKVEDLGDEDDGLPADA